MPVLAIDSETIRNFVEELHNAGYAVVVWTPEELGDTRPRNVENLMIERGSYLIEYDRAYCPPESTR